MNFPHSILCGLHVIVDGDLILAQSLILGVAFHVDIIETNNFFILRHSNSDDFAHDKKKDGRVHSGPSKETEGPDDLSEQQIDLTRDKTFGGMKNSQDHGPVETTDTMDRDGIDGVINA